MRLVVERDALKDALAAVIGRTKGGHTIPILTHVLIATGACAVTLTGHDLDSSSQVTIPAEVTEAGGLAIPADRLQRLVNGLPNGSQVAINSKDLKAEVRSGRSVYQISLLPPEDFPPALAPVEPLTITVPGAELAHLFKTPASSILQENSRIYLQGIYLHTLDGRLTSCATDGHTLIKVAGKTAAKAFDGVIIPEKACGEFVKIAASATEVTLEVTRTLVAVEAGNRRFVTKLIDATFPDYERAIPSPTAPVMTFDAEAFDEALARLVAACDSDASPTVKLTWTAGASEVMASLHTMAAQGDESLECDAEDREPGQVIAQLAYVRDLITALGGESIRFHIAGPMDPILVANPMSSDVTAVLMPCRK